MSAPTPTPNNVVIQAQKGPQEKFLMSPADIVIYGGARGGGKSYGLLIEALRNTSNPGFNAVIFRRTYPQIMQPDGLWDTSMKIYPFVGATGSRNNMRWSFPSGASILFSHMENEDDRYAWLGASIPLIGFDELATFSEDQFFFMLSSNRSTCGVRPYVRATTNPDSRSWVKDFIQWWWDPETGYPIEERAGKIRWFVRVKDRIEWADDPKELIKEWPELMPKSVTFIPAKVYDNQILMTKDPGYLSNLMALNIIDRERYLHGNWKIDSTGGIMFRREWFDKIIPEAPMGLRQYVRFWDLAATEAKKGKDPDYTCGVLMSVKDGQWYVIDVKRIRARPLPVEQLVKQTALTDPPHTKIRMEQEPGASGVTVIDHYARDVLLGYDFLGVPSLRNKVLRAGPLSAAAESHNVILVRGGWNVAFLDEMENFKGMEEKNDIVDATSGAMNCLKQTEGDWKFAMPVSTGRYDPLIVMPSGRYTPIGN